jgi:hypothetical protein
VARLGALATRLIAHQLALTRLVASLGSMVARVRLPPERLQVHAQVDLPACEARVAR